MMLFLKKAQNVEWFTDILHTVRTSLNRHPLTVMTVFVNPMQVRSVPLMITITKNDCD